MPIDPALGGFTAGYLANLASALTGYIVEGAKVKIRRQLKGSEEYQALQRSIQAGLVALLATSSSQAPEETEHLGHLFERFLADDEVGPEVGEQLALMLAGEALDLATLHTLFERAGYDAATLTYLDFDFEQGLLAFRGAFLLAAIQEPLLQPIIQTGNQLLQTDFQRQTLGVSQEMLDTLRQLVALLRQHQAERLHIRDGRLIAPDTQVIFQWPRFEAIAAPPATDWEKHYLEALIARCDPLDLTPIDDTQPQGVSFGSGSTVHISEVFTTLYLAGVGRRAGQTVAAALTAAFGAKSPPETATRARPPHRADRLAAMDETELPDWLAEIEAETAVADRRRAGRAADQAEFQPIQALEAVAALERLVILGRPGGGKSTLVNYLATQLARRRLGQAVTLPEGLPPLLPVRIILRRLAAWLPADRRLKGGGQAGLLWDYLEYELSAWGLAECFATLKQTLLNEGGIIFFDGLDEVQERDEAARRSLIKEVIEDFAAQHQRCRLIVTCREYAYRPPRQKLTEYTWRLAEIHFPVVNLALFDLPQIEQFTQTWYRIVGPAKGWDETRSRNEATKLYQAVESLPHLRELAQYPLLLTLMAQVHGRDGYLPEDRADLYERAVNLLLAHWENRIVRDEQGGRRVEPSLVMRLGIRTETLRQALERIAFEAHDRQERESDRGERAADIPREDLRDILQADLGSLDRADQVIAYIQERAGLLQARDNRTYAFPHRTFQEYLAATYLLKQSDFARRLRDRIRRDLAWWREVFLLTAGAARNTPYMIAHLVDNLLPNAPAARIEPVHNEQARLAGQALYEANFIEPVRKEAATEPGPFNHTYRRVQQWLETALISDATLTPAERAAAGDALARLGDDRPGVGLREDGLPNISWIAIPAGPFLMGSDKSKDKDAQKVEFPQYEVTLPAYQISRYPVTNAQYRAFVEDGGYTEAWRRCWTQAGWQWKGDRQGPESYGSVFDLPNHPVVMVTWYEAVAFCNWLTIRLRAVGRLGPDQTIALPSEAEWEKAARGADGRIYPWGSEADPNQANYDDSRIGATSAVGCFPGGASPYGCEEMSGNVWEWCRTRWIEDYKNYRPDDDLDGDAVRVLRGGSFDSVAQECPLRAALLALPVLLGQVRRVSGGGLPIQL